MQPTHNKGYNVRKKSIGDTLNEIAKLPKKDQVEALQAAATPGIITVLNYAVNPNIKFALPDGPTPYTPSELEPEPTALLGELRRLYLFVEGGNPNLRPLRREQLWVELLQYVDPVDAALLDLVKDKKLPEGLSAKTVITAFPNLY
jgi:hypothetical protein